MNRAMLEKLKEHLRTFKRDYWHGVEGITAHTGPTRPLAREIKIAATLIAVCTGAVALCFPPLAAGAVAGGGLLFASFAAQRTAKVRNKTAAQTTAHLPMASADDVYATLTGPASALRTVVNTQRMLDEATRDYGEYVMPKEVLNKLAPHFNDCAKAVAQLTAENNGNPLDSIALTRVRTLTDDYDGFIVGYYRENIIEMPTPYGVEKKQAAAEQAARTAAEVAGAKDGLDSPLTVKRIRLKVAA